ncbi:MAG TPA: isocitrate lyase/phosphoenolpyruvate mutase family protein [Pyrinomonadaceae bacterium]|nr:isocitrate lyase/phosphoenolpyruvate mutase family protein [Pyrinomonadaceae bacterium]
MTIYDKATRFHKLHIKGDPVVLFNIWDAGSARAVEEAGAKAIATGSWSVAAANGFDDGEEMPMDAALANIKRVVGNVTLPVTLDFEGGYTASLDELKANIEKVLDAGAVGINFEDQIVGGEGLYSIDEQSARIAAVREVVEQRSIPLFINARTDVFLKTYPAVHTEKQLEEAVVRAQAYATAGASGFFAPGLRDKDLIRTLCERSPLPVNIMVLPDTPSNKEMAELGVARISYGPGPYRQMIESLKASASAAFSN